MWGRPLAVWPETASSGGVGLPRPVPGPAPKTATSQPGRLWLQDVQWLRFGLRGRVG